jgi:predicted CXXCH cytochrome family protein
VATDSFGNRGGSHFIAGSTNLGTDLANDHPVSVPWTHQTVATGGGGGICGNCHAFHGGNAYNLPFNGSHPAYLECGTCHEPHNKFPAYTKLLRKELTGSAICLHCHSK